MEWVLNPIEEDDQVEPFENNIRSQSQIPNQEWKLNPQEDEKTGLLRLIGIIGKGLPTGALNSIQDLFGGGEGGVMHEHQVFEDNWKKWSHQWKSMELEEQGKTKEEIFEQLGEEPEGYISFSDKLDRLFGLTPRSPTERIAKGTSEFAGDMAVLESVLPGSSGLKSMMKGAEFGTTFGIGSNYAEEQGQGPFVQIATGLLTGSVKHLMKAGPKALESGIELGRGLKDWAKGTFQELKNAYKQPEGAVKFLEEKSPSALADLELSEKDITGRVAKTSDKSMAKFNEMIEDVAKPALEDVGKFNTAEIESEILKANETALLDTISGAPGTAKKGWEAIKGTVEERFNSAKRTYKKLYEIADEYGKDLPATSEEVLDIAKPILENLKRSFLNVSEESGIKNAFKDVINHVESLAKKNEKLILDEFPLEIPLGTATKKAKPLTVGDLSATKKSINRLLKKSRIIPGPVDLLKPLVNGINKDIYKATDKVKLGKGSLGDIFRAADTQFESAQKVFNNDAVLKLRETNNPEKMTEFFSNPSNLEKLKKSTGRDTKINNLIDRYVVENISSKSTKEAKNLANETREYIGKKGNKVSEELIEMGDSLTNKGQRAVARGVVLNDVQKAISTGSRPDKTLKMMQTKKGYDLVKNTFKTSPKGQEILQGLQRMTFEDLMGNIFDGKHIDYKKAGKIFENPFMKEIVEDVLGKEGLDFFKNIERQGKNFEANLNTLKVKEPHIVKGFLDRISRAKYGYPHFFVAQFMGLKTAGVTFLGSQAYKHGYRAYLHRVLKDPATRTLWQKMTKAHVPAARMKDYLNKFIDRSKDKVKAVPDKLSKNASKIAGISKKYE